MSEYTDWSPASVFGTTVASSASTMDTSSLLVSRSVAVKGKSSPTKRNSTVNAKLQVDLVVNNNDEDDRDKNISEQQWKCIDSRAERRKELATLLLQRQVQVWILRRQETLRAQEVQRLRGELRKAATCVIEASYTRYIKRRAISKYLEEFGKFETRLDELLRCCISRKRQKEEVQRFASFRRKQKQVEEDRKRKLVYDWLGCCIQTRHKKQEQTIAKAYEKLLGWVRRWTLRKRCEARVVAREIEKQEQAHQLASAQRIIAVYKAYKHHRNAEEVARRRRRIRDGLSKLKTIFYLRILRVAQSRWNAWIHYIKMTHESVSKVQQVYRGYQARTRYIRLVASCLKLQCVLRGYQARVNCAELKQRKLQEATEYQRRAAIMIQRHARGHLTRLWFRDALLKLRERFRCANCGAVEPGGTYCKYCGRHRPTFGPLSTVLILHEKWQQRRLTSQFSLGVNTFSKSSVPVVPSSKKPTLLRSRSASLRLLASSSSCNFEAREPLTSLPAVLSPRHRRMIARNNDALAQSTKVNMRRRSVASISEQTALRAMAIADLQAKFTASAHVNVLEMHLGRLHKANIAINR